MKHRHSLEDLHSDIPGAFYERVVRDISPQSWHNILSRNLTLRSSLLKGFSGRKDRLVRRLAQPALQAHLMNLIRSDVRLLKRILKVWSREQPAIMALLEMLGRSFLLDNWMGVRNYLGPERLFAGCFGLGHLDEDEIRK